MENKEIADSRLRSRYTTDGVYLLIFIIEQNVVGIDEAISAVRTMLSPLMNAHNAPQSI